MIDRKDLLLRAKMTLAAQTNPYHSVDRVFPLALDAVKRKEFTGYLGVKNVPQIPRSAIEALADAGFVLHTLDKAALGGRAVDIRLRNPISCRPMTGSSSGTAINVRVCFNDLGLGTDGGGSVLAPAMSVNLYGFISPCICAVDLMRYERKSTDSISFRPALGLMARTWEVLWQGIKALPGMEEIQTRADTLPIQTLRIADNSLMDSNGNHMEEVPDIYGQRAPLIGFLKKTLSQCDCLISEEGPVDLYGLGDSIFGHFDTRTKEEQICSKKGLIRVANMAGATAVCVPSEELGRATVFLCESIPEKIGRMFTAAQAASRPEDPMLEWYFGNLDQYLSASALLP